MWSLARTVRREREAAADLEALAAEAVGREPKRVKIDYAETLVAVAARRRGLVPLVGAAGELEDRVLRLLKPPRRAQATAFFLPAALLVSGSAALVAYPLPAGSAALAEVSPSGEDVRRWGPLDHYLGYNPVVEFTVAPGFRRLRIQGNELDAEQIDRWQRATTMAERAAIVRQAEAYGRRAPPWD